ncbi:MAG TPA: UvrD-helicase domain-containing protein [Bacillota bacterium]|nr:UvrD-helicase domain-containing protein [Bacillota bacterium]HOL10840.1 UvrD-helicase domain-containing protein [Bacillota bacterium]HPO98567.1 UvrD-helicase domain-containing protein [Bacillota bacterium]
MPYALNEEQLDAVNQFDRDLLVVAGAGTGKTSVLTQKYLKLLEERRAEVNNICAITFTNKAAMEMRERVRTGIEERLNATTDPTELNFWKEQLAKLNNARICTFHSLCLGLIKEHPLEAGIPPVSGILGEDEDLLFLKQAAAETLTGLFNAQTPEMPAISRILKDYGWESFIDSSCRVLRSIRECGKSVAEIVDFSLKQLERTGFLKAELTKIIDIIEEFLAFSRTQKLTDRAWGIIEEFQANWPSYKEKLQSNPGLEIIPVLAEIKKSLPKNLPKAIKEPVVEIHETAELLTFKLADQAAVDRLPIFKFILERIDADYQRMKARAGLLDFTDQQLLARNLLVNNPWLTDKLRRNISYLLVDEFQDTNSLQMEIINLLVGPERPNGGRWMAVGDVKQSIYRFRGAEADLIVKLQERFETGEGEVSSLTKNYRSNELIIKYANRVSEAIFNDEPFKFEPLAATQNNHGSKIEFILTGDSDLQKQANQVASYIQQLVATSQATDFPIQYQDIVLLFRSSTAMPFFQQALQELRIPFFIAGGTGFYHRQEIVDQINFLKLIMQKYDLVALTAVLTSPYVGLTEESLFWLVQTKKGLRHFYELEQFHPLIKPVEVQQILKFRELVESLHQNRDQLTIADILRVAMEQLNYRELMWMYPDAGERLANLEKLIMKAEEFALKGFSDVTNFLRYIKELEGVDARESDAPTQSEANNVVRMMTIHRAKGLEFPVVIIPDLDRKFHLSNPEELAFHKDLGLAFKVYIEDEGVTTSLREEIKERERWEEISELKRVLYVALTRAKKQLVLVGSGNSSSTGDTFATATNWMRWFELIHPFDTTTDSIDFHGIEIQVIRDLPVIDNRHSEPKLIEQYGAANLLEGNRLLLKPSAVEVAAASVVPTGLPNRVQPLLLKVSGLITYKKCPRCYYWKDILRIPELKQELSPNDFETAGSIGTTIGNFIHRAVRLQSTEWPELLWQACFSQHSAADLKTIKTDVVRMWNNLQSSEFFRDYIDCWDEVPFILNFNDPIAFRVEGRFDRLLLKKDSRLILVDYKTHRFQSGFNATKLQELAGYYSWQLQIYALAVESLWGRMPDQALLYFPSLNKSIPIPLDRVSIEKLISELKEIAGIINAYDHPEAFPTAQECDGCGYSNLCNLDQVLAST